MQIDRHRGRTHVARRVDAVAASEAVRPCAAFQGVVAGLAREPVGAALTAQIIVPFAAKEIVIAGAAVGDVVARIPGDEIFLGGSRQRVGASVPPIR